MKATITFEDGPDDSGTFKVDTVYEGGFTVSSHAHQHCLLLIKYLGSLAERFGTTQATEVHGTTPEAAADLAREMDNAEIPPVPLHSEEYVQPTGEEQMLQPLIECVQDWVASEYQPTAEQITAALDNMRRERDQQEVRDLEPDELPAIAHG